MARLAPIAALLSALLVAHGAAQAARPVLCSMTGTLAAGRCCCQGDAPGPAVTPDCCTDPVAAPVPTLVAPAVELAAPVASFLAVLAPPVQDSRREPPAPDVAATSPPLTLLHRSLLI